MIEDPRRIHLTSAYPFHPSENFGSQWLKANSEALHRITLTESIDDADAIIFIENHPGADPYFWDMKKSSAFRRYPQKCVLYHDADLSVTTVRTISPSIEKWQYLPQLHRPAHYIARLCPNEVVDRCQVISPSAYRYLFSFMGSVRTHPIRKRIVELSHEQGFLLDTSGKNAWEMDPTSRAAFQEQFVDASANSAFVLCPRGIGPATYRLFETMQIGRVPVIIADEWVPPSMCDWESFSVRIAEQDISRLPRVLEGLASRAPTMGKLARIAWERHFSPQKSLQTIAEAALQLVSQRPSLNTLIRANLQFRRPYHLRGLARMTIKRLGAKG